MKRAIEVLKTLIEQLSVASLPDAERELALRYANQAIETLFAEEEHIEPDELMEPPDGENELVIALKDSDALIQRAQTILARYLEPESGISESAVIGELLVLFDGPEQRRVQAATQKALEGRRLNKVSGADVVDQVNDLYSELEANHG